MRYWIYQLNVSDIWHMDTPIAAKAHIIAARIRHSKWYADMRLNREEADLKALIGDLEMVTEVWEFDDIWDQVYDIADHTRCWINIQEDHQNERQSLASQESEARPATARDA